MCFVKQISLLIPNWPKWLDIAVVEVILDTARTAAEAVEEVTIPSISDES